MATAETSAADLELLTGHILDFARKAIEADGFLVPVAATVTTEGAFVPLRRIQPFDEEDTTEGLVKGLMEALRNLVRDGRVRAVAWCFDARLVPPGATEKSDALVILRETAAAATVVIVPYRGAPGPGTTFAPGHVQPRAHEIFAAP